MDTQTGTESRKRNGRIIALIVVVLVALILCILLLLLRDREDDGVGRFVTEDNADDIMADMAEKVGKGMFECRMTTSWTFEDASSPSTDAYVANAESNLYALYFDVYRQPKDELLYSSPLLPVGTDIDGIKLDKKLPAGEYDAIVRYTLVDENEEEVSTVGFDITISVRN